MRIEDRSAVSTSAIFYLFLLAGSIFPILLVSIWMRLLYQRNLAAHEGVELAARIAEWQNPAPDLHTSPIPSTMPPAELRIRLTLAICNL
jgi:hypothetical protein